MSTSLCSDYHSSTLLTYPGFVSALEKFSSRAMYKLCTINFDICEVLHVEINQRVDNRSAAPHGVQQKMCRDFISIFANYGALVAPQKDLKDIMIVGCAKFFRGENFRDWVQKECLKVKYTHRADSHSVEECLRYSIVVWLESHHYYRCGRALIKGPFLTPDISQTARILFAVYCTSSGDVFLRFTSEIVRLLRLESWQLIVPSAGQQWVYCLPKLGRGQLVGKHSRLPPDCGFATYVEMRAYWKNCYGYDLPVSEPKEYYDIWFHGIKNSFLYPDFCVMSSEPVPIGDVYIMTCRASDEFFTVFASKERLICGEKANMNAVDPKMMSLSVLPTGSAFRRRNSIPYFGQSHYRGKGSFHMHIPRTVPHAQLREKKIRNRSTSNRTAIDSSQMRESFLIPTEGKPTLAVISNETTNPQKLPTEHSSQVKEKYQHVSPLHRKSRIDVE